MPESIGQENTMLNEEQLKALMADIESDTAERTESTHNTDKFAQAICAFANDLPNHRRPGYLLIGVKDDGALAGITATDDLLKNLSGIRSDGNILPQPMLSVAKSFDAQPCAGSKLDDLSLGQFDAYRREAVDAETIAANHRPLEQQLASLRLYDPDRHCATHAGMLLIGRTPPLLSARRLRAVSRAARHIAYRYPDRSGRSSR